MTTGNIVTSNIQVGLNKSGVLKIFTGNPASLCQTAAYIGKRKNQFVIRNLNEVEK